MNDLATIYTFEKHIKDEILETIAEAATAIYYYTEGSLYDKRLTVNDLYIHWMATGLTRHYGRVFEPSRPTPPLDVEITLNDILEEYDSLLLSKIFIPDMFPTHFDILELDRNTIMLKGFTK
jgi:hypothetical protein